MLSSEEVAREEKVGWKASAVMGPRCEGRVCRAGERGSQVVGSRRREERDVGVAVSRAVWRDWQRVSRSIICWGKEGGEGLVCKR